MNNKGITLISLVVTIIVLLILAGITIGTIFNDNGIIKKAQEAANATEDSAQNEQEALNGLLNDMDGIINGIGGGTTPTIGSINGKITWSTGSASLELTTDAEGVTIQYRKNSESSWTDYTSPVPSLLHGDKVYARGVKDGETVISEKQFDILDTTPPTVTIASSSSTTNSISATATATDNETGMGANPKYIFYIKKTSDPDSTYVEISNSTNASVTKEGLEQNTSYTIKVEVSDVAGNKGQTTKDITTSKIADAGDGLVSGAIVASTPVWSNGTASTTLSTDTGLTIQYQINGVDGSWTNGTNVTGLHHKDTVFARLTDGTNYGGEASVTILDTVLPQEASISLSGTSTNTEGGVTATVTLNDNESGVNVTSSKWVYNTNSGYIGTNESSYNNTFSSNGQTITLQSTTAGTYYLHVLTVDNAGNKKETVSMGVTVTQLVTGINVNPTTITLEEGQTTQLIATVTPDSANNKNVTWSSDNDNIASVNSSGLVTAKAIGSTTIKVTTTDGSNRTATCTVTVKKALPTIEEKLTEGKYVNYIDKKGIKRKCIVLYDNNSEYGVQIIATSSVEKVTLGKDYDEETTISDYNSAISILNTKTDSYLNTTYATSSRCVGSDPEIRNSQSGYYNFEFDTKYSLRDEDNNYETDYEQMKKLGIISIGDYYWLASRSNMALSYMVWFEIRNINASETLSETRICGVEDDGDITIGENEYGLRPVFTLKPGIKVTGGAGTESNPYTLGT